MTSSPFSWQQSILALLLSSTLFFVASSPILAHGTVISPPSRVWNCYQENPESPDSPACIAAVVSHGTQALYDWNEINQGEVDGRHRMFVPDGNLASGGRFEKYGGMDQIRDDWVATPVTAGPLTVSWSNSAVHATSYYEVYITTADWTPDQPLTWDQLELLVRTDPSTAAPSVDIPVTLPERSGRHVIYSIWQRSDSPEAFYSTSDIDFGAGTTSTETEADRANFRLKPSFPNPFQTTSQVTYQLASAADVDLSVYDIHGRKVTTLKRGFQPAGEYGFTFDGTGLGSGVYLCVLRIGNERVVSQRMVKR